MYRFFRRLLYRLSRSRTTNLVINCILWETTRKTRELGGDVVSKSASLLPKFCMSPNDFGDNIYVAYTRTKQLIWSRHASSWTEYCWTICHPIAPQEIPAKCSDAIAKPAPNSSFGDVSELWFRGERHPKVFQSNDSLRKTPPIFPAAKVRVLSAVWNNKFSNVGRLHPLSSLSFLPRSWLEFDPSLNSTAF